MKPEKLTQKDVLRRAKDVGLKFRIEQDGDRWQVLATSPKLIQPIGVGSAATYDEALAFVEEKQRQLQEMLPGIVNHVRDQEVQS